MKHWYNFVVLSGEGSCADVEKKKKETHFFAETVKY